MDSSTSLISSSTYLLLLILSLLLNVVCVPDTAPVYDDFFCPNGFCSPEQQADHRLLWMVTGQRVPVLYVLACLLGWRMGPSNGSFLTYWTAVGIAYAVAVSYAAPDDRVIGLLAGGEWQWRDIKMMVHLVTLPALVSHSLRLINTVARATAWVGIRLPGFVSSAARVLFGALVSLLWWIVRSVADEILRLFEVVCLRLVALAMLVVVVPICRCLWVLGRIADELIVVPSMAVSYPLRYCLRGLFNWVMTLAKVDNQRENQGPVDAAAPGNGNRDQGNAEEVDNAQRRLQQERRRPVAQVPQGEADRLEREQLLQIQQWDEERQYRVQEQQFQQAIELRLMQERLRANRNRLRRSAFRFPLARTAVEDPEERLPRADIQAVAAAATRDVRPEPAGQVDLGPAEKGRDHAADSDDNDGIEARPVPTAIEPDPVVIDVRPAVIEVKPMTIEAEPMKIEAFEAEIEADSMVIDLEPLVDPTHLAPIAKEPVVNAMDEELQVRPEPMDIDEPRFEDIPAAAVPEEPRFVPPEEPQILPTEPAVVDSVYDAPSFRCYRTSREASVLAGRRFVSRFDWDNLNEALDAGIRWEVFGFPAGSEPVWELEDELDWEELSGHLAAAHLDEEEPGHGPVASMGRGMGIFGYKPPCKGKQVAESTDAIGLASKEEAAVKTPCKGKQVAESTGAIKLASKEEAAMAKIPVAESSRAQAAESTDAIKLASNEEAATAKEPAAKSTDTINLASTEEAADAEEPAAEDSDLESLPYEISDAGTFVFGSDVDESHDDDDDLASIDWDNVPIGEQPFSPLTGSPIQAPATLPQQQQPSGEADIHAMSTEELMTRFPLPKDDSDDDLAGQIDPALFMDPTLLTYSQDQSQGHVQDKADGGDKNDGSRGGPSTVAAGTNQARFIFTAGARPVELDTQGTETGKPKRTESQREAQGPGAGVSSAKSAEASTVTPPKTAGAASAGTVGSVAKAEPMVSRDPSVKMPSGIGMSDGLIGVRADKAESAPATRQHELGKKIETKKAPAPQSRAAPRPDPPKLKKPGIISLALPVMPTEYLPPTQTSAYQPALFGESSRADVHPPGPSATPLFQPKKPGDVAMKDPAAPATTAGPSSAASSQAAGSSSGGQVPISQRRILPTRRPVNVFFTPQRRPIPVVPYSRLTDNPEGSSPVSAAVWDANADAILESQKEDGKDF